jgi:hypothetical protein
MSSSIKVARCHLVYPFILVLAPWAVLAFVFVVNLIPTVFQGGPDPTKALASIFAFMAFAGVLTMIRSLPFALALGASRRSFYLGTIALVVALAAVYGLVIAGLQALERATGGWGVSMYFFEPQYILTGAWYLTWLTSFVCLVLLFVYGMWFGLVQQRWDTIGLLVFVFGQLAVGLIVIFIIGGNHDWHGVGHFFTAITAAGLTGLLAALAAVLCAGGFVLIRGVTV